MKKSGCRLDFKWEELQPFLGSWQWLVSGGISLVYIQVFTEFAGFCIPITEN